MLTTSCFVVVVVDNGGLSIGDALIAKVVSCPIELRAGLVCCGYWCSNVGLAISLLQLTNVIVHVPSEVTTLIVVRILVHVVVLRIEFVALVQSLDQIQASRQGLGEIVDLVVVLALLQHLLGQLLLAKPIQTATLSWIWSIQAQNSGQGFEPQLSHPGRHHMHRGRPVVDVEHVDRYAGRQRDEDQSEKQILAKQWNCQTCGRNNLQHEQEEHYQ